MLEKLNRLKYQEIQEWEIDKNTSNSNKTSAEEEIKKDKICALNNWYDVKREGSKLTGFVEQVKVVVDGHHS